MGVAAVVGSMLGLVSKVHAQTPTITPIDPAANQLLVNGVATIQSGIFDTAALVWPYALTVLLFFLVIKFGMGWFRGGAH